MIYGLYLSATGVLTNSYRQDVIANNLANAETVGFKRSLALFQERRTEAQQLGDPGRGNQMLDRIGGGMLVAPTFIDHSEGPLEQTNNNLDVAIHGRGFFAVHDGSETRLTRNGRFMMNRDGYLILADSTGHRVLNAKGEPMQFQGVPQSQINIGPDGSVAVDGRIVEHLGLFDAPDESQLRQLGGNLLGYPNAGSLGPANGTLQSGFIENSNVDAIWELTQLIQTQRQLEANANMIRFQDQTLAKAVNEVGKIG